MTPPDAVDQRANFISLSQLYSFLLCWSRPAAPDGSVPSASRPRMKITRIETIPVRLKKNPERAIRSSKKFTAENTFLLVKMHTDDGVVGLGEVSCDPIWSGEDYVTSAHFIERVLSPLLIGEDPLQIERLVARIEAPIVGHVFTKSALEMALWDILGKVAGLPLYRLLGGPARDAVTTKFSISGTDPARAADIASWAIDVGFRAMKVKVGIDPKEDIARVRAIRQAIGPDVRLGIDANGGWSPRVAIRMIRELEEYDIFFAEQPVQPLDVTWLADVRRSVRVPIMADESVFNLQEAMAVLRADAADVLSVYVGKGGGISAGLKIAAVAQAAGATCTIGSNLELGVASAAMIHLAMATSGIGSEEFPCDIIGPLYYDTDLLAESLELSGGRAMPPSGPGLGVELDDDQVASCRVDLA